jgi:hypothetical protein
MKLIKKIACFILGHKWTSNALKNAPPTDEELMAGYTGFKSYAKMARSVRISIKND